MKKPGIHTSFQFVYLFAICKTCTSVPESILESVLECVLESEYQALESLDLRPIFVYNSSNIPCFSGKYAVCLLIFVPHEQWYYLKRIFGAIPFNQPNSKQSRFGMHECIPYENVVSFSIQLTSFMK